MKTYIKPQTEVAVIDTENVLATGSIAIGEPGAAPENAMAPKPKGRILDDFAHR